MDDDDEVREMNLSSRPAREEKRRARERERLERDIEAREVREKGRRLPPHTGKQAWQGTSTDHHITTAGQVVRHTEPSQPPHHTHV